MPGPAAQRNARRRNIRPDWRTLPPGGFTGSTPEWPIDGCTAQESRLWRQLWRTPQAEAWFDLGWSRVVARYARLVLMSESDIAELKPTTEVAILGEIRQLEDRLGLSPMAMKRLQWEVGPRETSAPDESDGNVVNLFG